jgi:FkbM family methyltransferase
MSRGSNRRREQKYSRYNYDGFCTVEEHDVVVDVGAFVGEFTVPASSKAQRIIAIEPDPDSFECLALQTEHQTNITAVNELAHEESKTVPFRSATDGSESSIFEVDQGDHKIIVRVYPQMDIVTLS